MYIVQNNYLMMGKYELIVFSYFFFIFLLLSNFHLNLWIPLHSKAYMCKLLSFSYILLNELFLFFSFHFTAYKIYHFIAKKVFLLPCINFVSHLSSPFCSFLLTLNHVPQASQSVFLNLLFDHIISLTNL